jgi:hypothetical protein
MFASGIDLTRSASCEAIEVFATTPWRGRFNNPKVAIVLAKHKMRAVNG